MASRPYTLKLLAGHLDFATTSRYVHPDEVALRRAVEEPPGEDPKAARETDTGAQEPPDGPNQTGYVIGNGNIVPEKGPKPKASKD